MRLRLVNYLMNGTFIYIILQTYHYTSKSCTSQGFTSKYNYTTLKKTVTKNPLIKDKESCIQINRIWKKHLLLT
jgi:hypothetical protein